MNRPQQQQQQRPPPNLSQVPPGMQYSRQAGLGGYPSTAYSIPPTTAMQQQQQQQRQQQNYPAIPSRMVTTPSYLSQQQRGANNSYFTPGAMSIPQMQPPPSSGASSISSMQAPSSLALQQQQQQNAAMQHLAAAATGTSSHSSENVIDQSDFPPLGSATGGNVIGANPSSQGSAGFHSTYASQAGTGGQTVAGNAPAAATQRDFGHDEFPPLGAQTGNSLSHGHDGLTNGFGSQGVQSQDQARQLMFGGGAGQAATSQRGMQALNSELDKRQQTLAKLNSNPISNLPWANQQQGNSSQQGFPSTIPNGHQHLAAPPNLPPPSSGFNGQQAFPSHQAAPQLQIPTQPANQDIQPSAASTAAATQSGLSAITNLPQTPAQQILLSAADRWGLLGLLASIKGSDLDSQLLGSGTDLAQIGLDLTAPGQLSSSFITPWADAGAAASIEPDFHLPSCYAVTAAPPGPQKVASFSEETLFFMFYSSPRDTLQEVAAQELYNRNWRYHKEAGIWLTKETGQSPLQKDATSERGTYSFFDPTRWEKVKKEAIIYYDQLEERALPQSLSAINMAVGGFGGMPGQQLPMRG